MASDSPLAARSVGPARVEAVLHRLALEGSLRSPTRPFPSLPRRGKKKILAAFYAIGMGRREACVWLQR